jgi:hypothetical protein
MTMHNSGLKTLGRLSAAALVGLSLSGCIDATMDVTVLSPETARATLTQEMGAEFYAVSRMGAANPPGETAISSSFCDEGELVEATDGGATCTFSREGAFADLRLNAEEDGPSAVFTTPAPGLVRVGFPTTGLRDELGAEQATDAETQQMMQAFFTGHTLTFRVGGGELVETNMTKAEDGKSAETVVQLIDILNGTANLPDELFAVVRAP